MKIRSNQLSRINNIFILLILFIQSCATISNNESEIEEIFLAKIIDLKENISNKSDLINYKLNIYEKTISLNFGKNLARKAFREDDIDLLRERIRIIFGAEFNEYIISISSSGTPIEQLVPNYYRTKTKIDSTRIFKWSKENQPPIVANLSRPFEITNGLNNNNIALWHSHGLYYNHKLDRWMFQRARLFQTIEDLGPMAFTLAISNTNVRKCRM